MYKNLSRLIIVFSILCIGMYSSVSGFDFSQGFSQVHSQSASISSLFKGKAVVSNIYSKALKIAKDKEVGASMVAFDHLKSYFITCPRIESNDFINILYHSNFSFKNTFEQIFPSSIKKPTSKDIDKSYAKIFTCRKITNPTSDDIQSLSDEINTLYYDIYSSTYTISNLNASNFGSDLFWNGTLDDSDFDLLYDINQIGKVLFDAFKDSPEILFYRLPVSKTSSASYNNTSSLFDQGSYQVGGGGSSYPAGIGSSGPNPSYTGFSSGFSNPQFINPDLTTLSKDEYSILDDAEVQQLIVSTNPSTLLSLGVSAALMGNQCIVPDTPVIIQEPSDLLTPQEYISGIIDFIETANIDDIINDHLLVSPIVPLFSGTNTSDTGIADVLANAYAEEAFGDPIPGSCEYACKDLPLDKQVKCEFDCAGACIKKCNDLGLQEKALCISDCMCFLVSGPRGKGWKNMEDMLRIKFCKVPVQQNLLRPGKRVFSIQAIFQEISDVLQGLRDSGQMVKFSKRKEFLDGNIKIKFADNFAFKLQVGFKPVFAQKSTTIKRQQETQANVDLNISVLDMHVSSPEADNYNKYIIISDTVRNTASKQPADSLNDISQNIQQFTIAAEAAQNAKISAEVIDNVLTAYTQRTKVLFIQNMIDFLRDNQLFFNNLSEALLDMNKMSIELKNKIESSN